VGLSSENSIAPAAPGGGAHEEEKEKAKAEKKLVRSQNYRSGQQRSVWAAGQATEAQLEGKAETTTISLNEFDPLTFETLEDDDPDSGEAVTIDLSTGTVQLDAPEIDMDKRRDKATGTTGWSRERLAQQFERNGLSTSEELVRAGQAKDSTMHIKTKGMPPSYERQYPQTPERDAALTLIIAKFVELGIIKECNSTHNSRCFMVPKGLTGLFRLVVDGRTVNLNTIPQIFDAETIEDMCRRMAAGAGDGELYMWRSDLLSAFYQMALAPEDQHLTAITAPNKTQYSFCVSPMGHSGSPAHLAAYLKRILHPCVLWTVVQVDDIAVFASSEAELEQRVDMVLRIMKENNLQLSLNKTEGGLNRMTFAGFDISKNHVGIAKSKAEAVEKAPMPETRFQWEKWLHFATWLSPYLPDWERHARPLRMAIGRCPLRSSRLKLTDSETACYESIKATIVAAPSLAVFQPNAPLELFMDCSDTWGGSILIQNGKVLAFHSFAFRGAELFRSIREKEWTALPKASYRYSSMFTQASSIQVYTDHASLSTLITTRKQTSDRLLRTAIHLSKYNIKVNYLKGSDNAGPDYLSRVLADYRNPSDQSAHDQFRRQPALVGADPVVTAGAAVMMVTRGTTTRAAATAAAAEATESAATLAATAAAAVAAAAVTAAVAAAAAVTESTEMAETQTTDDSLTADEADDMAEQLADTVTAPASTTEATNLPAQSTETASNIPTGPIPLKWEQALAPLYENDDYFQLPLTILRGKPDARVDRGKHRHNAQFLVLRDDGVIMNVSSEPARICLPAGDILNYLVEHTHLQMIHSSAAQLASEISTRFFVPGLPALCKSYVDKCAICFAHRRKTVAHGLHSRWDNPGYPFQVISIDFMTGISEESGCNAVLVVIDELTKIVRYIASSITATGEEIVQLMIDNVFTVYGYPLAIKSDQQTSLRFGKFAQFCKRYNITQQLAAVNHHQHNVERSIGGLRVDFGITTDSMGVGWYKELSAMQLSTNRKKMLDGDGLSPSERLFGYQVAVPTGGTNPHLDKVQAITDFNRSILFTRPTMQQLVDSSLEIRAKRAEEHDAGRVPHKISEGTWVAIPSTLANIDVTAAKNAKYIKSKALYVGPFRVERMLKGDNCTVRYGGNEVATFPASVLKALPDGVAEPPKQPDQPDNLLWPSGEPKIRTVTNKRFRYSRFEYLAHFWGQHECNGKYVQAKNVAKGDKHHLAEYDRRAEKGLPSHFLLPLRVDLSKVPGT
jgi:hypothetical protein